MAIEKIVRKKGVVYRAIWINPITKRKESKCFESMLAAKHHECSMMQRAQTDPQAFAESTEARDTFQAIAYRYIKDNDLSPSTRRNDFIRLRSSIIPAIGHIPAVELTRSDARAVEAHCRERGNKQNTIQRAIALVKAVLSWAVTEEIIPNNPLRDYACKRGHDEVIQPPTQSERDRIWAAAEPHLRRAIILATATGARVGRSELLAIRWDHISFEDQTITIWSAVKNRNAPYRVLDLSVQLLSVLTAWRAEDGPDQQYVIHYAGQPIKSIKRSWATALRRAGITRRIRPYDMRHFFATEAIRSGADLKAVAEILGHANMTMILKHYQHTIREQKRVALDAITIPTEEKRGNFCGNNTTKTAENESHENKFVQ